MKDAYLQIIKPSRSFFKLRIAMHFRAEEKALYPILVKESPSSILIIKTMIAEHSEIMKKFVAFEIIVDYKQSIKALTDLMNDLSEHVRNEDELFSSINLSQEATTYFDNIAQKICIKLA